MNLSFEARRRWVIAFWLAAFMALAFGIGWLLGMLPSFEEKCQSHCNAIGKSGHMEYIYPEQMTRGTRGRGPKECKCS